MNPKTLKNMGLLDWTYLCNFLMALIAVKANGSIAGYLSSSIENVSAPSRAFGIIVLAMVVSLGTIFVGAILFWRRFDLPVFALVLTTIFLTDSELLSLLYFVTTLAFATSWFFFWRKDYLQRP